MFSIKDITKDYLMLLVCEQQKHSGKVTDTNGLF